MARAAAKRAREVIMVTDRDTAYQSSDREELTPRRGGAALSVYGGGEKTEPAPCRAKIGLHRAREQG